MISPPLRVALAEDEPTTLANFSETLSELGHQVVCCVRNGRELVERCRTLHPDLVITDIKMPDLDGLQATEEICRDHAIPIIVISAFHGPELLERAQQQLVMGYLVKPVKQDDLKTAIVLAMRRFEQLQQAMREREALRQSLEERKLVERAKGILMRRANLSEEDAFLRLTKTARDRNQKLVEVAQTVLLTEEMLRR